MTTVKLYWNDPYMKTFSARILEVKETKNSSAPFQAALDQTAFYPEGGGQPADHGHLNGIPVIDVFEDAGIVWHVLTSDPRQTTSELPAVRGEIDWSRRFDHMQQHLGQHVLSAVFEKQLEAHTIGFHLGEQNVTIDLDKGPFPPDLLLKVEVSANEMIYQNRSVYTSLITKEAYQELPLRKTPDIRDEIRIVEVPDLDLCACSGTHPHHTGAVGLIKILKSESYKGGCRVAFHCGLRALHTFQEMQKEITVTAGMFSVGWPEVSTAVTGIQHDLRQLSKTMKEVQQEWALLKRDQLLREAEIVHDVPVVMFCDSQLDEKGLQFLANSFRSCDDCVALLGITQPAPRFVLLNNTSVSTLSMKTLLEKSIHHIEGKGGGNAASAQGGGSRPEGLGPMLTEIKESVITKLSEQDHHR